MKKKILLKEAKIARLDEAKNLKATSLFCQPAINSLAGIQLDSVSSAVITRQKDK